MPDVQITLDQPKVPNQPSSQYIRVRYRLKGTSTWSSYETRDNNTYTKTLSEGIWEIEANLMTASGDECIATIYELNVKGGCDCLTDVSVSVTNSNGVNFARVNYTLPGSPAPCGYRFYINNSNASSNRVLYFNNTQLANGHVDIALNNGDMELSIEADCCNYLDGYRCALVPITYPSLPCTGWPPLYFFILPQQQGQDATFKVTVRTFSADPVPPMTFNVSFSQYAVQYPPGLPQTGNLIPDTGVIPVTIPVGYNSNTFDVIFAVHPNLNTLMASSNTYRLFYRGVINYPCNGKADWTAADFRYTP